MFCVLFPTMDAENVTFTRHNLMALLVVEVQDQLKIWLFNVVIAFQRGKWKNQRSQFKFTPRLLRSLYSKYTRENRVPFSPSYRLNSRVESTF